MNSEIVAPNSIVVFENLIGANQFIEEPEYQAILLDNVFNSTFVVRSKLIKILLVRCDNVTIILQESLISSAEIFQSMNIRFVLTKEVPMITIENSKIICLYSANTLNFLNTYSDDIYVIWGTSCIQKVPLILFSQRWLWTAPYNTEWKDWSRTEISYLIQDSVLNVLPAFS